MMRQAPAIRMSTIWKIASTLGMRGDAKLKDIAHELAKKNGEHRHFNNKTGRFYLKECLDKGLRKITSKLKTKSEFYESQAWRSLRYEVLKYYGAKCQCCGTNPTQNNPIQVDHIKPRSKYPELELDFNNLQVLCKDCNHGKFNTDETDWRKL